MYPATHVHDDEPATEKVFAGQGVHTDDPLTAAYVLAGQARHDVCWNLVAYKVEILCTSDTDKARL